MGLAARDWLIGSKLKRIILERPAVAKELAKEFKGTNMETYFTKLWQRSQIKKIADLKKRS